MSVIAQAIADRQGESDRLQAELLIEVESLPTTLESQESLLRNRDRLGFLYPKCHCEGRSAAGTPRLEDGGKPFVMPALPPGSWRREGHGASLPVMRASAREEMRRISLTIRSSSRLFAIHSRYRTSSSSVSFKPTVFPRALRVQWW